MTYDLELVRAILLQFGFQSEPGGFISTDGATLSPPSIVGADPTSLPEHTDRLVEVGLLRVTNEIHMRNHSDPVTLRVTGAGETWVQRAFDDDLWDQSLSELTEILTHPLGE